jgi:predicted oxidoreductase
LKRFCFQKNPETTGLCAPKSAKTRNYCHFAQIVRKTNNTQKKKMRSLRAVILFVALHYIFGAAVVPQVPLCNWEGCPTVSRIGLGTLHLGDKIGGLSNPVKINEWINTGVDAGITLFDTADVSVSFRNFSPLFFLINIFSVQVYPVKGGTAGDSAKLFGQALKLSPGLRNKIQIVAKMGIMFPNKNQTYAAVDTTANHLLATVDWFLDSLQTKYLDVVLIHYPNAFMNAEEVAQTFSDLRASGKVRHFGVSNHYPSHFDTLQAALTKVGIRLVTNEVEISVWNPRYMNYDKSTVDHAYANGYHNIAWGGLAGDSTGGLNRLFQKSGKRQTKILDALTAVGTELGVTDNAQLALAWTLAHPSGIIPLIGTTQVARVTSLVEALTIAPKITTMQWWKIGGEGGLCALADDQCDYKEYR